MTRSRSAQRAGRTKSNPTVDAVSFCLPRFARLIRDRSDVHPSRPNIDDEQDVVSRQPEAAQQLDGEEVGS